MFGTNTWQIREQYQEVHNGAQVVGWNIEWEDFRMNENVLEEFTAQNGLSLKANVFHGSIGKELRKVTSDGVCCVGYINGGEEIEIYVRSIGQCHELINDRLWFLGKLFRLCGYNPNTKYRCIGRVKTAQFNLSEFIALARNEFSVT